MLHSIYSYFIPQQIPDVPPQVPDHQMAELCENPCVLETSINPCVSDISVNLVNRKHFTDDLKIFNDAVDKINERIKQLKTTLEESLCAQTSLSIFIVDINKMPEPIEQPRGEILFKIVS
jgi:hypothetical protein